MVKENEETKKNALLKKIVISAVIVVGIVLLVIHQYSTAKAWSDRIYPGVKIENQDLSGKTKEQAKSIIEQKYGVEIAKKKLNIKTKEKTYTLEFSKINPKYDIDGAINEAFKYGKDTNLLKKYGLIKFSFTKQYALKFEYDHKPLDELIDNIEKEVNKEPVDATLNISEGNFKVVPEKKGEKLQKDKLKKDLSSKINGKIGQDMDIQAPMETVNAKITGDKINSINYKIGEFSTEYGSISSPQRANNIMLAAQIINGKILMPGDTFSFNDTLGERTAEKGYQAAPVIVGNQVESGLGGGICQVSSTLYNAVIRADIKSIERTHHTLPSHYVKLGMDATVDYGSLDYKFKNTLKYPIYIQGDASGGVVSFNVYSNNSLAGIVTDINSDVYQTVEANVKYEDDATLLEGKTEVVKPPSTGYKVKVTKTTTQNGTILSQDVIADDYYEPVEGLIKRGIKKPEVPATPVAAPPVVPPTTTPSTPKAKN
jgi:vancomycin resistance protein YoaR